MSSLHKGLPVFQVANLLNLDASTLGNHEFDKGSDLLAHFIRTAKFPVLAANIDFSNHPGLQGLIVPQVVKQFDGDKVAIIGLAPLETPWISSPDHRLVFNDPIAIARKIVERKIN